VLLEISTRHVAGRNQDTTRRTPWIFRHDTSSCRGGQPRPSCRSHRPSCRSHRWRSDTTAVHTARLHGTSNNRIVHVFQTQRFLTQGIMCPMYNFVTYNWRNLIIFGTKCMLQIGEPSERATSGPSRADPSARSWLGSFVGSRASEPSQHSRSLGSARPAR
jgi:hypothetical protein